MIEKLHVEIFPNDTQQELPDVGLSRGTRGKARCRRTSPTARR
jgi:hypothetical protein